MSVCRKPEHNNSELRNKVADYTDFEKPEEIADIEKVAGKEAVQKEFASEEPVEVVDKLAAVDLQVAVDKLAAVDLQVETARNYFADIEEELGVVDKRSAEVEERTEHKRYYPEPVADY